MAFGKTKQNIKILIPANLGYMPYSETFQSFLINYKFIVHEYQF